MLFVVSDVFLHGTSRLSTAHIAGPHLIHFLQGLQAEIVVSDTMSSGLLPGWTVALLARLAEASSLRCQQSASEAAVQHSSAAHRPGTERGALDGGIQAAQVQGQL